VENIRKAQRKPLELLFAVLVARHSAGVTVLQDRMWPDLEGDSARGAFDLSLHRLRKLLHHKEAIIVSGGKVTLNRDVVWIDVDAFEKLCALDIPAANVSAHRDRLLDLYRGPLLPDEDLPWLDPFRDRLRGQFVRAVLAHSRLLQIECQWAVLTNFLQSAVDAEPLEELFYRDFMKAYLEQGRISDVIAVYNNLAAALKGTKGNLPSPTMRAFYAKCQADHADV